MDIIKKEDLVFDYKWSKYRSNDPRVSGALDDTHFNPEEGNQVLYLINRFLELHEFKKIASGQKAERIIKAILPLHIRKQSAVSDWICQHWQDKEFK
jgi:hypothetical protein